MASPSLYLSFFSSAFSSVFTLFFARLFKPQTVPQRDLTGQTAIVTGSNSGIGLWIAIQLARQGADVCLACRNQEKGDAAVSFIQSQLNNNSNSSSGQVNGAGVRPGNVFCWKVDFSDMESVHAFCSRWNAQGTEIDMLVHNAGIADAPVGGRRYNEKGRDVVYVTNVIGSVLMTHLLEQRLSRNARVVFTSSGGSYNGLNSFLLPRPPRLDEASRNVVVRVWRSIKKALGIKDSAAVVYGQTKAHQILFAALLQKHFSASQGTNRTAHAFAPGFTQSAIFNKFEMTWRTWLYDPVFSMLRLTEKLVATDTDEGAKTGAWLAACGSEKGVEGGRYWEWMRKEVSVVDFSRAKMGEEAFMKKAKDVWKEWEMDAGCKWDLAI
ncbi:hypothetical protein yc1106_02776 [Curvularia clavata]|uniref:NAD(P)-binding protein n=1 Tax=Curvularia clavata TaxID=95742 RepID=A0A9Q9DQE3_CURCL|nr:hypothetical protein yc1106_02776 [Curvularia clavata]